MVDVQRGRREGGGKESEDGMEVSKVAVAHVVTCEARHY